MNNFDEIQELVWDLSGDVDYVLDNLSNWPYFHYFKNEDDEFIDAVSYGYDFGKEVSAEEFVAMVFPNGLPTRSKRKKRTKKQETCY